MTRIRLRAVGHECQDKAVNSYWSDSCGPQVSFDPLCLHGQRWVFLKLLVQLSLCINVPYLLDFKVPVMSLRKIKLVMLGYV